MASIIPSVVADAEFQLSTSISIGATTFSLASATDDDGVALPSGIYCFTVDNGSSNKEYLQGLLNGVNVTAVKSISRQTAQTTGAVRAHRVGSPCIISDFSSIAQIAKVLNGLGALDGASPLIYDVEPTISDRKQIATLGKVLDLVTGGTVTFDTQTVGGILAGETIASGDSVYLKESDQRWWLTDADTVATVENVRLGIALGAGTAGVAITGGVLLEGVFTTTGLTAGSRYFLGNTPGARTTTAGTNSMVVGVAYSTTKLLFSPAKFNVPSASEKAAMVGGSTFGTPSATNKYITEAYNASATGLPIVRTYLNAASPATWTKPAGLKYIIVEVQAGGGGGGSATDSAGNLGSGGGGGGYSRKQIATTTLGATETVTIGAGGAGGNPGSTGGSSSFGSHATATGGTGGASVTIGGSGGSGSSGDVNITGSDGVSVSGSVTRPLGDGGSSFLGGGILGRDSGSSGSNPGYNGKLYGAGGGGSGRNQTGGTGAAGIVIVTEYYS
jgi:hypothetical protein